MKLGKLKCLKCFSKKEARKLKRRITLTIIDNLVSDGNGEYYLKKRFDIFALIKKEIDNFREEHCSSDPSEESDDLVVTDLKDLEGFNDEEQLQVETEMAKNILGYLGFEHDKEMHEKLADFSIIGSMEEAIAEVRKNNLPS